MSVTITETILAAHCGREPVEPGEFIRARVDMAMGNDLSAGGAVGVLRKVGAARVWDPDRIAVIFAGAAASAVAGGLAAPEEVVGA